MTAAVNLYAYVGNDPVNGIDPTGQYECVGGRDCNRIERHVRDIRRAARNAERTTGTRIQSMQARALRGLVTALGTAGDGNGVNIASVDFEDDQILGTNQRGPGGSISIQLDFNNIDRSSSTGAGTLGHELTHGLRRRSVGEPGDLAAIFNEERLGNWAESMINEQLSEETSVWSRNMTPQERAEGERWRVC